MTALRAVMAFSLATLGVSAVAMFAFESKEANVWPCGLCLSCRSGVFTPKPPHAPPSGAGGLQPPRFASLISFAGGASASLGRGF